MGRLLKGTGRVVPAGVLSAKEQAAHILASARQELEARRAQAQRQGYEAGLAAGKEEGLAQVTELLATARAQAEALHARVADPALVLARRMAEKIVGRAVELSPAVMGDIVAQAVAASRARAGALVVRVHPDDLAAVEAEKPRWADRLAAAVQVRIVADPKVGRAGCVLETSVGRLDARLDTQLAALERAATRARPGEPEGR
jgi:flagellar biosynthesis/type III secretory pathway protein FliH